MWLAHVIHDSLGGAQHTAGSREVQCLQARKCFVPSVLLPHRVACPSGVVPTPGTKTSAPARASTHSWQRPQVSLGLWLHCVPYCPPQPHPGEANTFHLQNLCSFSHAVLHTLASFWCQGRQDEEVATFLPSLPLPSPPHLCLQV